MIRRYATQARRIDHSHFDLHGWPTTKKPTPLEIFNLKNDSAYTNRLEYDKALKSTYQKLIKLYHPDLQHEVVEGSASLLAEQKRLRFDAIQDAYEVLKDPRKRNAFQKYQSTSWDDYKRGQTGNFDAYRMANAHRQKYSYANDPKFWHAATWEDYYRMRYARPAPTMEDWEKNKWKILWKVLAVSAVVVCLQIMLALERTDEFNRRTRMMNLKSSADMENSYANYDEGDSKFLRIRRFLLYRRLGLSNRDAEDTKREENDILTKFAQLEVAKFD